MASQNGFYEIWDSENNLGQKATVKLMKNEFLSNPKVNQEFKREATQAAHLIHPGITRVLGFEEGNGMMAIIKENHGGTTLKENLKRKGPFKEDEILRYFPAFLQTLEFVHNNNYIIGNLNYENTAFVTGFGLKINDISKDTSEVLGFSAPISSFGAEAIAFKSPEQLQGIEQSSKKSDFYSAGIILYTLLKGKPPFNPESQSLAEIYRDITQGNLPAVSCSPGMLTFLSKMIAVNPAGRFNSFTDALQQFHASFAPTAPSAAQPIVNPASAATQAGPVKYCINNKCGKSMPVSAKFCGACGTKWQELNLIACKYCTSPIEAGSDYCPYCENPL